MRFFKIFIQIYKYSKLRKKYWILPLALILVTFAIIFVTSQGSVIAPFIYTFF